MLQKAELSGTLIQGEQPRGGSSRPYVSYIGLDVHKKTISYCARRMRLVKCTRKARSVRHDWIWTTGSRRYPNPG